MKALTKKQRLVLDFLQEYSDRHGFPPTMREIGQGIGVPNVSAVRGHLAALEKKGYILKHSDQARAIRVLHSPSAFSRFKRKLHEIARTDKGVVHHVVYGIAMATRGRGPFFSDPASEAMAAGLERMAVEHGWTLLARKVESDHVAVVVKVWPNHSPELVARRIRAAGSVVARRYPQQFPAGALWADGYVVTTEIERLEELLKLLLEETAAGDEGPKASADRENT